MASHRLGRYTLLDELAQGGMSRVYVAQKDGADGVCVLKQLLVELKTHEFASKRFHREAHIASFLSHPHIARLLDAGFEDDSFCIAMEYIAGADLESIMRAHGKTMPWELAVAVAIFLLDALAYAHDALDPEGKPLQVVHRDIAPRNVMVGFQGDVKLIDFGLARGKVGDFETEPGVIIGTLRYLSPEQARSEEIDRRTDIYSSGVVLHELLTGNKLVQEKTPLGVLKAIMNDSPPLMRTINPDIPPGIEIAVQKALEKNPADRWLNGGDFRDAITDVVGQSFARAQIPKLGELVRKLFPEGERKAAVLRELGRHRFASVYGKSGYAGTLSESAPQEVTLPPDNKPAAQSKSPSGKFQAQPPLRAMSTPWSSREDLARLSDQLDQPTRTDIPPSHRPPKDSGNTGAPPIPRPRNLRHAPESDPSLSAIDPVEGPTIPIKFKPAPSTSDPNPTDPGGPPLQRHTPPGVPALLDSTDSDATIPSPQPSPMRDPDPTPALPVSVDFTRRERAQPIISDPVHADPADTADRFPRDHTRGSIEDETAIANHPLVRRRIWRNRIMLIALVGGVVALILLLAIAFDQLR